MEEDDDEPIGRDREMTLGTSFIIGIFFALMLICGIFFAFGYSLGRRSALPASGISAPAASHDTGDTDTGSSTAKPSSGVPASQEASADVSTDTPDDSSSNEQTPAVTPTPTAVPAKLTIKPSPVSRTSAESAPAAVPGAGQSVVQVAAVSRKGDADMLVGALKRHGYNAAIHQSAQDKLLHVQIGPFASKKDAEAMRQKLTADGYNAIVK
jgi:cell division septation protein DedD